MNNSLDLWQETGTIASEETSTVYFFDVEIRLKIETKKSYIQERGPSSPVCRLHAQVI